MEHHTENSMDKYNSISTIIPQNHPFRNLLFDYVPKNKRTNWNEDEKKKYDYKQQFVEFLYTEHGGSQTTRLIDFIVTTNASAKQALSCQCAARRST